MHDEAQGRRVPRDVQGSSAGLVGVLAPAVAAILSLVAAISALRLWDWRPGAPIALGGDSTFVTMQLGRLVGPESLRGTDRLGAPFGQSAGWFPSDDQIHFLAVKVLGLFSDSPYTVGAVYFVLGFPAAALTAYWLLRELGARRAPAVMAAVLFSVMPGHQLKFEHLWLAGYWVVPLGLWVVLRVGRGLPLWAAVRRGAGRRAMVTDLAWNARTLVILVCVAIGDVYYLAFMLILLAVVTVLRRLKGERRFLFGVAGAVATMVVVAGVAIASTSRGKSADVITGPTPALRAPAESEKFAGKVMDLILPWYEHRAGPLRFLTTAYNAGSEPSLEHPALGFVALAGVVGLLVVVLRRLFGDRGLRLTPEVGLLGVLTLAAFAFYIKGGLGSFVAIFVTPQIRTWSRLSLYIGFFGLAAVALWLTHLQVRGRRVAALSACGVLLVVGVLDQTSPDAAADYRALSARISATTAFTSELEGKLAPGCRVFQLPVVEFPESPAPGDMEGYDHLVPYLTSTSLRWSHGAMRGTAAGDWQLALPTDDPGALSTDLAAAGFCAVEVDSAGYSSQDNPTQALASRLGTPLSTSPDGRLTAFDLAAAGSTHATGAPPQDPSSLGWQVLHPVVMRVKSTPAFEEDGQVVQWVGPRSTLILGNMTGRVVRGVTISLELRATQGRRWSVSVEAPGGRTTSVEVPAWSARTTTVTFDLPPGQSTVGLRSDIDEAYTLVDGRLVSGKLAAVTLSTTEQGIRTAIAPR
jgi:hypothetical protein